MSPKKLLASPPSKELGQVGKGIAIDATFNPLTSPFHPDEPGTVKLLHVMRNR
jgi:hypothetical protein